jgi:hypothetical protein
MTVDIQEFTEVAPEPVATIPPQAETPGQGFTQDEIIRGFHLSQLQLALTNISAIERIPVVRTDEIQQIYVRWQNIYKYAILGLTRTGIG